MKYLRNIFHEFCTLAVINKNVSFERNSNITELFKSLVVLDVPFLKQGMKNLQDLSFSGCINGCALLLFKKVKLMFIIKLKSDVCILSDRWKEVYPFWSIALKLKNIIPVTRQLSSRFHCFQESSNIAEDIKSKQTMSWLWLVQPTKKFKTQLTIWLSTV